MKTGKKESRDSEQMTGLSIAYAVFRNQTQAKGILMSSREIGASRPRQTQKIGVNPGAFFRYPKTHEHMLLNSTGVVKRSNAEKTRFLTSHGL